MVDRNRSKGFFLRLSTDEADRLAASAKRAGMTKSAYIRLLLSIETDSGFASSADEGHLPILLFDKTTIGIFRDEVVAEGRNFNQAVHVMNILAKIAEDGDPDGLFADYSKSVSYRLDAVIAGWQAVADRAAQLSLLPSYPYASR